MNVCSMSLCELRSEVTRLLRLDHHLETSELELSFRPAFPCNEDVVGVRLLPGGNHVVVLCESQLELRSFPTGELFAAVPVPGDAWTGRFTLLKFEISIPAPDAISVLFHVVIHRG
jgi:hypothetical protein